MFHGNRMMLLLGKVTRLVASVSESSQDIWFAKLSIKLAFRVKEGRLITFHCSE